MQLNILQKITACHQDVLTLVQVWHILAKCTKSMKCYKVDYWWFIYIFLHIWARKRGHDSETDFSRGKSPTASFGRLLLQQPAVDSKVWSSWSAFIHFTTSRRELKREDVGETQQDKESRMRKLRERRRVGMSVCMGVCVWGGGWVSAPCSSKE